MSDLELRQALIAACRRMNDLGINQGSSGNASIRLPDGSGLLVTPSSLPYEAMTPADIVALDLASTPAIAQRSTRAQDVWEAVFPTIMMGDDRAIRATWVAGQRLV